ncbi:MAG: hypothetical protein H0X17_08745 [Deltaproteobacteria bacterium]|nr:hypothetical protein [Deltaproteobacteria bacterium]
MLDPRNPIFQLCVQGVEAEAASRVDEARTYFEQAWRASSNHVEACIAAHYIARHQTDPSQALFWNQVALARADAVADPAKVRSFYASLHLNLGMAHEKIGQLAIAHHHYSRAALALESIVDSEHRVLVEYGVSRGLKRTQGNPRELGTAHS